MAIVDVEYGAVPQVIAQKSGKIWPIFRETYPRSLGWARVALAGAGRRGKGFPIRGKYIDKIFVRSHEFVGDRGVALFLEVEASLE